MSESDRYIPAEVKRSVRQRCGFGCVICGKPLYEYDHMEEWAKVRKHVAEDITLLCDQHHKEVTNKLLGRSTVRKANQNPFNLNKDFSVGHRLIYDEDHCAIILGNGVQHINKKENGWRWSCAPY